MPAIPATIRTVQQRREGSRLLKQVDLFVREGALAAALNGIEHANVADPLNPCTAAYEERVRGLIGQQEHRNGTESVPEEPADAVGRTNELIREEDRDTALDLVLEEIARQPGNTTAHSL